MKRCNKLGNARTVFQRLKRGNVYPLPRFGYTLSQTFTLNNTPKGYNGPHGDPLHFRFGDPIQIAVSLLKKTKLHGDLRENFCFKPEVVIRDGVRVFTRDINSAFWWERYVNCSLLYYCLYELLNLLALFSCVGRQGRCLRECIYFHSFSTQTKLI